MALKRLQAPFCQQKTKRWWPANPEGPVSPRCALAGTMSACVRMSQPSWCEGFCSAARAVLKGPDFFFLLRTAPKDRPKGPPTANRQLPSTANRHQPPTTNRHQPPATNRCQPPPTASCQLPTTANRHQPPITNHQPPPTATNRQLPTANRQMLPTANRQPPPNMVEHMECPRAFLGKLVPEHFFFSVKDRPQCSRGCH